MPLPPDNLLPAQSIMESVSRGALALISLLLVVLLGGILKGIFYTNVVGGGSSTDSHLKVNCSNCGARIREDDDSCDYCGDPAGE